MTTLPNLTPCPKPDCKAPITHWHHEDGELLVCHFALRGEPCPHGDQGNPCYAPRETAPLHLPDVEMAARAIYESDYHALSWAEIDEGAKDAYRSNARTVLDLIAAHQPVWQRVEPGTVKPGMVLKRTDRDGGYTVFTVKHVETYGDEYLRVRGTNGFYVDLNDCFTWEVDSATAPAEPEDPRLAVVVEWSNEPAAATREEAARDLLARLDALEADR